MILLEVGATASMSRTVTDFDVRSFVDLVGDQNPVHTDEGFAAGTRFGKRIAPGMWSASLIAAVLGTKLPGSGTIYLSQSLRFLAPVFIGDTITAEVRVLSVRDDKPIIKLETRCRNQRGEQVLDGEALVLLDALKTVVDAAKR